MEEEKGTITINLRDKTKDAIERFDIKSCGLVYITGMGPELSLNQAEEILLYEEDKKRNQSITGVVMYFGHVSGYDILFSINQLARALSKHSEAHMGAAKRSTDFSFTYNQGGFKLTATMTQTGTRIPITAGRRLRISYIPGINLCKS